MCRKAVSGLNYVRSIVIVGSQTDSETVIPECALDDLFLEPPVETLPAISDEEVAYDSLLLMRRKELHQRIGQAIEGIYAERLDLYEMLA